MRVAIGKVVNVLDFVIVTQGGSNESSKLVRQYQTFRASTVVRARYQNLFWVVPHKLLRYCRNVHPTWVKFNSKDTKESEWCSRF